MGLVFAVTRFAVTYCLLSNPKTAPIAPPSAWA
jgi:hypothetical protein